MFFIGVFMKPTAFRIQNYKSIKDTGKVYFDPKITVIAGKNEAGKTAILEALEDFNLNKKINEKAIPIQNETQKPEITIWFEITNKDVSFLEEQYENQISLSNIMITKLYPDTYKMYSDLKLKDGKTKEFLLKNIKEFEGKGIKFSKNLLNAEILDIIYSLDELRKKFIANLTKLKVPPPEFNIITTQFNSMLNSLTLNGDIVKIILNNLIPNIILFSSFDDKLPNKIPIASVSTTPIIQDLIRLAEIDVALIQPNANDRKKEKHKRSVNLKFSDAYSQFWKQDDSILSITWDNQFFFLWIEENEEFFEPEQRSKGRQWHLSFYIRITARTIEGKMNLILVDEPGLFLHAKAQKDILLKLEDCSQTSPIVYSTHSPYLISRDHLDRIRLVVKNGSSETEIKKLTANVDKETLTPILTAIGEDLSSGIKVDKTNSVVVEGFSDYLWLKAFYTLLEIKDEINIIPSVGASNVVNVGCILFGWGLNPLFILDNDNAGKTAKKKLMKKLGILEDHILPVPNENEEGTIEDMFSDDDYKKYIDLENSEDGKIILATKFYNSVKKEEILKNHLSEKTLNSFGTLFKKIKKALKIQKEK